jgi:hypothetical protein
MQAATLARVPAPCLCTRGAIPLPSQHRLLPPRGAPPSRLALPQEAALAEALDAQLRAHRPRAGRVEEEGRAARADELVSQRRRLQSHLADHERAAARATAAGGVAAAGLREAAAGAAARLRGGERLLGQAQSVRGADAAWRQTQALRVRRASRGGAGPAVCARQTARCLRLKATSSLFTQTHTAPFHPPCPPFPGPAGEGARLASRRAARRVRGALRRAAGVQPAVLAGTPPGLRGCAAPAAALRGRLPAGWGERFAHPRLAHPALGSKHCRRVPPADGGRLAPETAEAWRAALAAADARAEAQLRAQCDGLAAAQSDGQKVRGPLGSDAAAGRGCAPAPTGWEHLLQPARSWSATPSGLRPPRRRLRRRSARSRPCCLPTGQRAGRAKFGAITKRCRWASDLRPETVAASPPTPWPAALVLGTALSRPPPPRPQGGPRPHRGSRPGALGRARRRERRARARRVGRRRRGGGARPARGPAGRWGRPSALGGPVRRSRRQRRSGGRCGPRPSP